MGLRMLCIHVSSASMQKQHLISPHKTRKLTQSACYQDMLQLCFCNSFILTWSDKSDSHSKDLIYKTLTTTCISLSIQQKNARHCNWITEKKDPKKPWSKVRQKKTQSLHHEVSRFRGKSSSFSLVCQGPFFSSFFSLPFLPCALLSEGFVILWLQRVSLPLILTDNLWAWKGGGWAKSDYTHMKKETEKEKKGLESWWDHLVHRLLFYFVSVTEAKLNVILDWGYTGSFTINQVNLSQKHIEKNGPFL